MVLVIYARLDTNLPLAIYVLHPIQKVIIICVTRLYKVVSINRVNYVIYAILVSAHLKQILPLVAVATLDTNPPLAIYVLPPMKMIQTLTIYVLEINLYYIN